jgi:hypothetical protein
MAIVAILQQPALHQL